MSRTLKILVVALTLAAIGIQQNLLFNSRLPIVNSQPLPDISLESVKVFFPDAQSFLNVNNAVIEVYGYGRQKMGELLYSSPYSDKIIGFAGTTPLIIVLDEAQRIKKVHLLANHESPDYIRSLKEHKFFDTWNKLSIPDALHKKVDAVSGSTYTTQAVTESLQARLSAITNYEIRPTLNWSSVIKSVLVVCVVILALYSFFRPAKAVKLRFPLLVLSLAILGFWQSSMLSLAQFLSWVVNGVHGTPWSIQIILFTICMFSVLLPLFTGKAFYCIYLCPFGAAQELAGKITKKKINLGHLAIKYLMILRKTILIFIVLLLIVGINFDLSYIEPFSAFNRQAAPLAASLIACISLVLAVFIQKPWCRFFCPTGQVLDMMKNQPRTKKQAIPPK